VFRNHLPVAETHGLKTPYITGGGTLYSIRTTTPGRVVWPN